MGRPSPITDPWYLLLRMGRAHHTEPLGHFGSCESCSQQPAPVPMFFNSTKIFAINHEDTSSEMCLLNTGKSVGKLILHGNAFNKPLTQICQKVFFLKV